MRRAAALVATMLALAGCGDGGGADSAGTTDDDPAVRGAATLDDRFDGIPQDGSALGEPDAPYTLVEFADLQCPFCAAFDRTILPAVIDRYVRPGKLRLELRPVAFIGADSSTGAAATGAAGTQDRMWQFADLFYRNQGAENSGYVTPQFLGEVAHAAGLEFDAWQRQSSSRRLVSELRRNANAARTAGVDGTPDFRLGRTGRTLPPFDAPAADRRRFLHILRLELRFR